MARWKPEYVDPAWDALVALVKAQNDSDKVGVKEVVKTIHVTPQQWAATGIYILSPGMRPEAAVDTEAEVSILRFTILCNSKAFTEGTHVVKLAELVGLVVDAVETDRTLQGKVAEAWIEEVRLPVVTSEAAVVLAVAQEIIVRASVYRTPP